MRLKIHHIPASAAFLLGLFAGVAIMNLAVDALAPKSFQEEYGQSLAKLTAQRAVEATFHQNLVELHAILEELLAYPQVELATIHDVENQLLVQAGEGHKHKPSAPNSFSAPVILQDSIAGYVTVTIPPPPSHANTVKALLYLLDVLLLTAAISVLVSEKAITIVRSERPVPTVTGATNTGKSPYPNDESLEHSDNHTLPALDPALIPKVYALIQIKNAEVLKQQLSGDIFRTTQQRVSAITKEVLALYNGAGFEHSDDQLVLAFYATDAINEALFRATCSAFLIVELASIINNIPLDLAAYVSADKDALDTADDLPIAGLVLEATAAKDEVIQRRLRFMKMGGDDNRQVVSGFAPPFEALLENQHKQLSLLI